MLGSLGDQGREIGDSHNPDAIECSAKTRLTDRSVIDGTLKQNQIGTLSIRRKVFGSALALS